MAAVAAGGTKKQRSPSGNRVMVELKIKDATKAGTTKGVTSRLKSGTAKFLGLPALTGIPKGKNGKSPLRGSKGTKSFKIVLKDKVDVNGTKVKTLSIPVPGTVGLDEFYTWATQFKDKGVIGIVSPNGVSYGIA
jgi:hypothetical protein